MYAMKSQTYRTWTIGALIWLAVGALALTGCSGVDCGEGTTEVDGTCRLEASGCGEGTVLVDGVCVPTESACGPVADPVAGEGCVPNENVCSGTTTFDQETRKCVADTEVVCGDGTTLGDDGVCQATEQVCAFPTVLGEEGFCVVGVDACEGDTTVDPTTGACVTTEVDCGDGLVWDDSEKRCMTTDEVCRTGTRFDDEVGVCVPEGCVVGDVVIDRVCLPPEAARLRDPDHEHVQEPRGQYIRENRLTLPVPGDDPLTVRGQLVSQDEDGDTLLDEVDYDAYAFSGDAFEWVEITMISFGQPGAYFELLGPSGEGRVWRSPPGDRTEMSRQIVLPESGLYRLGVSYGDDEGTDDFGGYPSWYYGLIIQTRPAPTPQVVDVSQGAVIEGDVQTLRDNLYRFEGVGPFQSLVVKTVPGGQPTDSFLQFWDGTTLTNELEPSYEGTEYGAGPGSSVTMLLDWRTLSELPAGYELVVEPGESRVDQRLAPGETVEIHRVLDVFDTLEIKGSGFVGLDVISVEVFDPSGTLVTDTTLEDVEFDDTRALESGTYRVRLTNKSRSARDANASIRVDEPSDLGTVGMSGATGRSPRSDGSTRRFEWVAAADGWFEVRLDCNGESFSPRVDVYGDDGVEVPFITEAFDCDYQEEATGMMHVDSGAAYMLELSVLGSAAFAIEARAARPTSVTLDSVNTTGMINGTLDCSGNDYAWGEVVMGERGFVDVGTDSSGDVRSLDGRIFDRNAVEVGYIGRRGDDSQWLNTEPYLLLMECGFSPRSGSFAARVLYLSTPVVDVGTVPDGLTTQTLSIANNRKIVRMIPPGASRLSFQQRDSSFGSVELRVYDDLLRDVLGPRTIFDADSSANSRLDHVSLDGRPFYVEIEAGQSGTLEFETDATTLDSLGPMDSRDVTVTGRALGAYDSDYFEFEVTEPMVLDGAFVTGGLPSMDVSVLEPDGTTVTSVRTDSSFVLPEQGVLMPGTYLLKVRASAALSGPFQVGLSGRSASFRSAPNIYVGLGGTTVQDTLTVSGCGVATELDVLVETQAFEILGGTDVGSLDVELVHPSGTTVTLSQSSGQAWDDARQIFGITRAAVDSLASLEGTGADGVWTLRASDTESDHTSDVDMWALLLRCE